jgi:hypothetical protein
MAAGWCGVITFRLGATLFLRLAAFASEVANLAYFGAPPLLIHRGARSCVSMLAATCFARNSEPSGLK